MQNEQCENERSLSLSLTYCVKAALLLLFIDRLYSTRVQSRSLEILRRNIFFPVVSRLMKHTTHVHKDINIFVGHRLEGRDLEAKTNTNVDTGNK